MKDPLKLVPPILNILAQFGKRSGYKINFEKSEMLPVNLTASLFPALRFPFRVVRKGFKYLGTEITPSFPQLFIKIFAIAIQISCWTNNLIKMIVLPKFLYLFQNIHILIKKSFFNLLETSISSFIWNGKPPKIKRSVLQRPKKFVWPCLFLFTIIGHVI